MKTWLSDQAFKSYARCGGDSRWITPPERLSEHDRDWVEYQCHKCPVRGECISHVVENADSGVWCASVFVPEVSIDDSPRRARVVMEEAAEIRLRLSKTVPEELARRGEF